MSVTTYYSFVQRIYSAAGGLMEVVSGGDLAAVLGFFDCGFLIAAS